MKVKTSITLSEDILGEIDKIPEFDTRSELIESALLDFLKRRAARIRDERDLKILNKISKELNAEVEDTLSYQVKI